MRIVSHSPTMVFAFATLLACARGTVGGGQEPEANADALRDARGTEMRRRAMALVVRYGDAPTARRVEPHPEPLLRYGDATREFYDGTLWAWTFQGRPFLIASLEQYSNRWSYELISVGTAPLEVEDESGWLWKPPNPPATTISLSQLPQPALSTPARRRQLRDLARQFSAVEFTGEERERVQLRLQPRAIYEYDHPQSGLLVGSIFVFSNGTNPELLLVLKIEPLKTGGEGFRFLAARTSAAALELSRDGAEVWSAERITVRRSQTAYTAFALPLRSPGENRPLRP